MPKLAVKRRVRVEGEGARLSPLHMRTTKEIREKLEAAALASGRTLSGEVEHIIQQHFLLEDVKQAIREEMRAASRGQDSAA